jgi:dTDP-4-dehydrorhamnose 3,5-epimerase-like enzyme
MNIVDTASLKINPMRPKLFGDERGCFQEMLCKCPRDASAFPNDFTGLK